MKPITLIPLITEGGLRVEPGLLKSLSTALATCFRVPCRVRGEALDVAFAFDPARRQYWSTAILERLQHVADPGERVLAVTASDLYVPIFTFVFGEAQLAGNCALVSTARLVQEFYGMPSQDDLARERLIKEAVHELGHTFGLRHCRNWQCAMSSSHAVESLDVKEANFCGACRKVVDQPR